MKAKQGEKKQAGVRSWRQLDPSTPARLALYTETTNRERVNSVMIQPRTNIDLNQQTIIKGGLFHNLLNIFQ